MNKFGVVLFSAAALLGGAAVFGWQVAGANAPAPVSPKPLAAAPQAPPITVAPVVRSTVVETLPVTGTLLPRSEVLAGPEIEGLRIVEILVEAGDRVAKGDVLVRLSRETLDAQLAQSDAALARADAGIAQARSQISQAEASASLAQADLGRSQSLLKTGAATQAVVDQRVSAAAAARAQLQAARDALRAAEAERKSVEAQRRELMVRIARTEVRTPVAGLVARRNARLGAVASGAGEALFRIIEDGDVELEAEVPEARLGAVRVGMEATVTVADGAHIPGRVRLVSPEVDRATRLGRVRISLSSSDGVRVGSFARADIQIRKQDGVTVPVSALNYGVDGVSVLVAEDGVARKRGVSLGVVDDSRAEIRSGLNEGEAVVERAGAFLRDGDAITAVRMRAEAR